MENLSSRDRLQIVSGGQTGVDRAALDVALDLGIEHGGWCPRSRRAEDGRIPDRYRLRETDSRRYSRRTERNVVDSDGTLILHCGPLTGGTLLTQRFARQHHRPLLLIDLRETDDPQPVLQWMAQHSVARLNVAGPRESSEPGVYERANRFLRRLFSGWPG